MNNKRLFLIGALVCTTYLAAMEPEDAEMSSTEAAVAPAEFGDLPGEVLLHIIRNAGSNLEILSGSIQEMRLVNRKFRDLIDNKSHTWDLIKFLSEKYNYSPMYIASRLKFPSAIKLFNEWFDKIIKGSQAHHVFNNIDEYRFLFKSSLLMQGENYIIPMLAISERKYKADKPPAIVLMRILYNGQVDPTFGLYKSPL